MIIIFVGQMGSGKTNNMGALATFFRLQGTPIYANYDLWKSKKFESWSELMAIENGVICFDEMHMSMDSRISAQKGAGAVRQVVMSHWLTQIRKKSVVLMATTQHISQVDVRIRNLTDIVIWVEQKGKSNVLQFIDWQYGKLGSRYANDHPERFYGLYDTFEIVPALRWDTENMKNIQELKNYAETNHYGSGKAHHRTTKIEDR